jgi:hypothetical protein
VNPDAVRQPTVAGSHVSVFNALVSPAAFLISPEHGTHEITRCYYDNGKYVVGPAGMTRLGPYTCIGADLERDFLTLVFSGGIRVAIPVNRVQVTYQA